MDTRAHFILKISWSLLARFVFEQNSHRPPFTELFFFWIILTCPATRSVASGKQYIGYAVGEHTYTRKREIMHFYNYQTFVKSKSTTKLSISYQTIYFHITLKRKYHFDAIFAIDCNFCFIQWTKLRPNDISVLVNIKKWERLCNCRRPMEL